MLCFASEGNMHPCIRRMQRMQVLCKAKKAKDVRLLCFPCIHASEGCKGCRLLVTLTFGLSVTLQLCFAKLPRVAKDADSVLCKATFGCKARKVTFGSTKAKHGSYMQATLGKVTLEQAFYLVSQI